LKRFRKKADAKRRVPLHARAFLRAVIKAPVRFFSRKLLAMIARALRAVNEALNMRARLIRMGLPAAWSASITAYRWGNRSPKLEEGRTLRTILGEQYLDAQTQYPRHHRKLKNINIQSRF
jgi:hypothetical protein